MRWQRLFEHTAPWLIAGFVTCSATSAQQSAGVTKTTDRAPAVVVGSPLDPLRQYLPRADLFMQVPGGKIAIDAADVADPAPVEEQRSERHGGLVIGYCLKASCSRVTHLAVLQVCSGLIGGPEGRNHLVLGVVRLPFGKTPGYVRSLQGRNYMHNFTTRGPNEQQLIGTENQEIHANYNLLVKGTGEVAPLEYVGFEIKAVQSLKTLAVRMTTVRDIAAGIPFPRIDVRHLCKSQTG